MQPTILTLERVVLLGYSFYGDPFTQSAGWTEENEIGKLWQRFMKFWEIEGRENPALSDRYWYEIHTETPETTEKGFFDVFVGAESDNTDGSIPGPLYKILPSGEYALFTMRGKDIFGDWFQSMMSRWLPEAGLKQRFPVLIQRYDERFKGMDRIDESELDILIPVLRDEA